MHTVKYFVRHYVQISVSVSIKGNIFAGIYKKLYFLESILNFRVIAYNDAGPSEPGEASEPVVIDVPGVQVIIIILITIRVDQRVERHKRSQQ